MSCYTCADCVNLEAIKNKNGKVDYRICNFEDSQPIVEAEWAACQDFEKKRKAK